MKQLCIVLAVVMCMLCGCAWLGRAKDAANTPDPITGKTPAEVIVKNLPAVIAAPYDIPAWLQIIGAITGIVLTASGGYAIKQRATSVTTTQDMVDALTPIAEAVQKSIAKTPS